jgi:hypothetical protein
MKRFTEKEDQFIRDNYLSIPIKRLARMMGRAEGSVTGRFRRIGLVLPPALAAERKAASTFKKGCIPPNKGKGMSREIREKVSRTWFPSGHQPHNTKEDGMIVGRIDNTGKKYLYIREAKSKWELLHRHLWRKHHGQIPAGLIVAFKDGNSENCVIENLELIDRAQNMRRNTIHNLPEEIRDTKLLIGSLTRKINNYVKNNNRSQGVTF